MAKKQKHQQEALWEFVQTELVYINKLKIIKDVGCHSPTPFITMFVRAEEGFSTGCLTNLCLTFTVGYCCSGPPAPGWPSPRG